MRYLTVLVKLTLVLLATTGRAQQLAAPDSTAKPADDLSCRVLTGRITDPFAFPLTGATIMLRSPDKSFNPEAFSTNSEGHYIITSKQAIPRNSIMEVTAIGFTMLEQPLTNCTSLDLTMTPLAGTSYKVKVRGKKAQANSKAR